MKNNTRVIALVLLAAAAACSQKPSQPASAPAAAKVQNTKPESDLATITLTAEAEKHLALQITDVRVDTVTRTRTVGGEAIVPPGRAVVVSAPVAGTALMPAGRGSEVGRVKRGEVLFELVPLQQSDRDARAEAERKVKEAEARLTEAAQRLQRLEQLLKDGSTSARSVEEARASHAVAVAAVEAARADRATLTQLPVGPKGELSIASPLDGVLIAVRAASGQAVAAGAPLFEVADVDPIWIRVGVYAGEVASVDATKPASIAMLGQESANSWRPARPVAGPPSADPAASSTDLFFQLANAGGTIRPGERLAVRLALKGTEKALLVPRSAIIYDLTGGTWVYEARAPHVFARRRVEVEVAGPAGDSVIIRRGLTEGIKIVTVGAAELYGTEFFVSK